LWNHKFKRLLKELAEHSSLVGIPPSVLVSFSEPLRSALTTAIRQGEVTLPQLSAMLGLNTRQASAFLAALLAKGFLEIGELRGGIQVYTVRMSAHTHSSNEKKRSSSIWDKLGDL
jgi:hypothetical protein